MGIKKYLKNILLKLKFKKIRISYNSDISLDSFLGENIFIGDKVIFGNSQIGSYSYISNSSIIKSTKIGSFCSIGSGVKCNLGNHPTNYISTYPGFYSDKPQGSFFLGTNHDFALFEIKNVIIENDVWIGDNAIILGGVIISTGSIIAAGAVVTKNVPPYSIVAGVPAKVIGFRFDEILVKRLLESNWWDYPIEKLKSAAFLANEPYKFLNYLDKE